MAGHSGDETVEPQATENGTAADDGTETSDLAALEEQVSALEEDFDAKVEDVRERVIQVKRETDTKAPDDHDHETLREDVATSLEQSERARETAESLAETVDAIDARLERGFENYEEILQYLVDRTDDLAEDANALYEAVTGHRQQVSALRAREHRRRRTEALKDDANRKGVTEARCESCGNDVSIALLTGPTCPFCGVEFAEVTPNRGFFGSATLETGAAPALEGADAPAEEEMPLDERTETAGSDGIDPTAILDEDGSPVDVNETEDEGADRADGER